MNIIIIIDSFGFPNGMASVSRIRNFALGLSEHGASGHILILRPSEYSAQVTNDKITGFYKGFKFKYTSNLTIIPKNFLLRNILKIIGILNAVRLLFVYKKSKNLDYVIFYARNLSTLFLLGNFCKILKVKSVLELCEWPLLFIEQSWIRRLRNKLYCNYAFHWIDAVIVISQFLENKVNKFSQIRKKPIPQVRIPILVNFHDFKTDDRSFSQEKNFLFCGSLDHIDIMNFLFEVIKKSLELNSDHRLILTGSFGSYKNYLNYFNKTKCLGIEHAVIYKGYLSANELKELYKKAIAFLAPLPSGERSISRFPSKIGEYLATGKPVITTNIGDIPLYLKNRKSAFLVQPDSVTEFSAAINSIISDVESAKRIGRIGQKVARIFFNPINEGKKIVEFLCEINK